MDPYLQDPDLTIWNGDALTVLETLPEGSVQCCVTSPPYWGLRDYGTDGQLGLEPTPAAYVQALVAVMRDVRRVLTNDGTLWLNLGDSYNSAGRIGHRTRIGAKQGTNRASASGADWNRPSDEALKEKDLVGIPWRVAFALQADGWYLRCDVIWAKPNAMPESVTDRPTRAHEYLFLLAKSERYYYDAAAIREPLAQSTVDDLARRANPGDHNGATRTGKGSGLGAGPRVRGDKQRGHGRRHAGFNERWDGMTREEQRENGANKRSVWTVATKPFADAHFAVFPEALIEPCILAGCPEGGTVLDCFGGSGTTALVARKFGRKAVLIELNADYCALAAKRLQQLSLLA